MQEDRWRPEPNHPSPQFARQAWGPLNGRWQFAFDDLAVGVTEQWERRADVFDRFIEVPFPFESAASGIGDTGFHPVCWYRLVVPMSVATGHRLLLHFGAVDYRAHVWVNGQSVAYHEGGHTPFSADITPALDGSGSQTIVVRADDSPIDLRQPRGKQDWQRNPHAIWYDRTSGIWQPVWWEEVPEVRLRSLRWIPNVDIRGVDLTLNLRTDGRVTSPLRVRVVLSRGEVLLADDTYLADGGEIRRQLIVGGNDMNLGFTDVMWSPESPNLIQAVITLSNDDGVIDEVHSYTALRSFTAARGRLLLNSRPYFLRLILSQNFWPQSHLAAPDDDAFRREVQLIKDLGFNGVRLHQKVEDPRFLAWCDRLGLLVWAEMPAAYEFSRDTIVRLTREWLEVIKRDSSHPCIIAWVPINESWGVPTLERSPEQDSLVRSLYHLTKAMDPDRLVIGNDGWEQPVTDVITIHDYTASETALLERYGDSEALDRTLINVQPAYRSVLLAGSVRADRPVVISEFGGVSLNTSSDGSWAGYGWVHTPEQLLLNYQQLVQALLDSSAIAGFCWTQLTDVQQERNGLLTEDRQPKVALNEIKAVTTGLSAAIPGDAVSEFAYGHYTAAQRPEPPDA